MWLSIERTDKAYSIRQLRGGVEERRVLKSKLEIERDRLLAPQILREKAAVLGMSEARAGQIGATDPEQEKVGRLSRPAYPDGLI